jgi:RNA polymerase sigma factor (sigma-70 family)
MALTRSGCRYAHTLFNVGSVGGLTDGELLGLFISRRDEAGELAFTVLVERHGPMVLRVCRSILRDENDAHDALQATFLILMRRCRSVRKQDSVASWLHGVALRVAACTRAAAARRRLHEHRAAAVATTDSCDAENELDLAPALHEELDRLPQRYRAVIVLCYLEGLACEAAAIRLGVPVGTVKSRLARGRDRLRGRLIRRGLALSGGVLGIGLATETVQAALPGSVVKAIARTATSFAAGEEATLGAVSASMSSIIQRIAFVMSLSKMVRLTTAGFAIAVASIGIVAFAQRTLADPPGARAVGKVIVGKAARGDEPARVQPEPILEKALQAADRITIPLMKAYALADIASAQARLGQAEPARATFRRSAEIIDANRDDPSLQVTKLAWFAKAQAIAGDRAGTRATIAKIIDSAALIDDLTNRRNGLDTAARWQADGGNAEGALELLGAIKDAPVGVLAYSLSVIAGAQAKAGDVKGARSTMARAYAEAERAEKEPPKNGQDPVHFLDPVRWAQVRGIAPLAIAEAKAGDVTGARASLAGARIIADRLRDERKPSPLAEIAMAYRVAGDQNAADEMLKSALVIAFGLPTGGARVEALSRVAIVQADAGDRPGGRKTLDQAK